MWTFPAIAAPLQAKTGNGLPASSPGTRSLSIHACSLLICLSASWGTLRRVHLQQLSSRTSVCYLNEFTCGFTKYVCYRVLTVSCKCLIQRCAMQV